VPSADVSPPHPQGERLRDRPRQDATGGRLGHAAGWRPGRRRSKP